MMNICLLGDFSKDLDEGYKNTSHYLATALEEHNTVFRLNGKQMATAGFWRDVARACPQIVHLIAQPTSQSFLFVHLLRRVWPQARVVISALRAERFFPAGKVNHGHRGLVRLAHPDLVLVQTAEASALFNKLACPVAHLPNGVDLQRFRPATQEARRHLRPRYGLDPDRPVALHVGHLKYSRNLAALRPLSAAQIQVVVAGSLYLGTDPGLIRQLEGMGFRVLKGYQPQIEELYMLADCYVFPPEPGSSLTMPISVLEAMACDLPVISTRFQGLSQAFRAGNGLRFVDHTDDFLPHVQEVLASPVPPGTRQMVGPYSWRAIGVQLQSYYQALLDR